MSQGTMAAQVAMNTTLSAAACGLAVLVLRFAIFRKYDIGGMCNGILAGLVSITAPCGNVECGSAVLIGILGAFIYQGSSMLLQKLKVDDPVDAFAVHGACGAWGVLAAALFDWGKAFDHVHGWSGFGCMTNDGKCAPDYGGELIKANLAEIGFIILWSGGLTALVFIPLRLVGWLVAPSDMQADGFDLRKHSPPKAYTITGG